MEGPQPRHNSTSTSFDKEDTQRVQFAGGAPTIARPRKQLAANDSEHAPLDAHSSSCTSAPLCRATILPAPIDSLASSSSRSRRKAAVPLQRGWRRDGSRTWRGRFKSARALRLPPGTRWDDVESRITRDIATGELLEDRHVAVNPARTNVAGQRLDRARDIESIVTLIEAPEQTASEGEVIDLTVDSGGDDIAVRGFEVLAAGQKWADIDSD